MGGHGGGDPIKVIKAALYANFAIAVIKFVAAYLSSSTATLAEAVHSVADSGNQALLLVGLHLAAKRDDRYAFGRAGERYFWPFIVALLLFTVGGAFALYEGIHRVLHPTPPDMSDFWSLRKGPLVSLAVLGVSVLFESYSCSVALKEFRRSAGDTPLRKALFDGKDPTIPLVLMEDIAALTGLTMAMGAVGLAALTGNGIWDGAGSILIGLLLMCVAVLIAIDAHSLILGERATPEMERLAQTTAETTEGVRAVTQMLTLHLGPDFVVLALKVAFEPGSSLDQVEKVTDDIERRVRDKIPMMKKIFVEPDSDGDRRGVVAAEVAGAGPTAASER
ncbi:MAG: cation diffusion facilitator family transporter [Polyangiaceae bacterium]